jgi:hypothetical protein
VELEREGVSLEGGAPSRERAPHVHEKMGRGVHERSRGAHLS